MRPIGHFLWGYLKELIYNDPLTTEIDLVAHVYAACTFVGITLLKCLQSAILWHAHAWPRYARGTF